ncbi:MAG: tRNA uracil 4-sulfurtransferase ThiI [Candidatus Micrarchaeota archaeon]
MLISVVYSEIMMKGGNRRHFESLLINNILASLKGEKFKVRKGPGRILLSSDVFNDMPVAREAISRTFGVDYVSFPQRAKADIVAIIDAVMTRSPALKGKAIRVDTKRSDKGFPLTSPQVNSIVGKALVESGSTVDLDNPDTTISIEILPKEALIFTERFKGPSGLPVGSSGKILSLLSGGIDSPVSSWMMMKRGCVVDFLHLHSSPDNRDVIDSKMKRILKLLRDYSPAPLRIHVAPYTEFYKASMSVNPKIELVVFRRFLFHLANALAKEHGYKGVVSGDSVGQVASQTIDNIFSSDEASTIPVFRPLAGLNKQEIIDLAMKIGTFAPSIEPYKDCCSLVAQKKPSTRVALEEAKKAEEEITIMRIVEKTLAESEVFEI